LHVEKLSGQLPCGS